MRHTARASSVMSLVLTAALAACAGGSGAVVDDGAVPPHVVHEGVVFFGPLPNAEDDGQLIAALEALLDRTQTLNGAMEQAATCPDKRAAAAAWRAEHRASFRRYTALAGKLADYRNYRPDIDEKIIAAVVANHLAAAAEALAACGDPKADLGATPNIDAAQEAPLCRRLHELRDLWLVARPVLPMQGDRVRLPVPETRCDLVDAGVRCAGTWTVDEVASCFRPYHGYEASTPGRYRWTGSTRWPLPPHQVRIEVGEAVNTWLLSEPRDDGGR